MIWMMFWKKKVQEEDVKDFPEQTTFNTDDMSVVEYDDEEE